ncbi:PhoH family protein [Verrucomicrobiota bacterium]
MKKYYVLDTNVLLHDPTALKHFDDNHVIIPLKVIEEIDQFKREVTELGRNARQLSRALDELRQMGSLSSEKGVELDNGGDLRVVFPKGGDPFAMHLSPDDQILRVAAEVKNDDDGKPVIVVSKDINMRLKADAIGLQAEDYENGHAGSPANELYTGIAEIKLPHEALVQFKEARRIEYPHDEGFFPNQYIIMKDEESDDEDSVMLGRYDAEADRIVALIAAPEGMRPIRPRNIEQQFAVDALLNDRVKVVTLLGKAGTGKTLLAVAAGVMKTLDEKVYEKMLVSRPTFPMGKDLGYLPGSLQEKLDPWMQPIHDALDLIRYGRGGKKTPPQHDFLKSHEQISVEPLSYIRGRSIPNQYMVIDESQNLTPLEIKTVVTRVGHGTKIIFTGDIYQIDNPYVDCLSNGLSALVERVKDQALSAHVELTQGVRSEVAEMAANLL